MGSKLAWLRIYGAAGPRVTTGLTAPSITAPRPILVPTPKIGPPIGLPNPIHVHHGLREGLPPPPGNPGFDLGGLVNEIFRRLPIPRPGPRLPPGPTVPGPGRRFPLPIPIPLPGVWPDGGGDQCPKGFHLDKESGSKCVRNRRMNSLNPRALNRAIRRVCRFQDFVNKSAMITGTKVKRKIGCKKRGKPC